MTLYFMAGMQVDGTNAYQYLFNKFRQCGMIIEIFLKEVPQCPCKAEQ